MELLSAMPSSKRDKPLLPASETHAGDRTWIVQGYRIWRIGRQFTPPTDIIEREDRMIVLVEIAGMKSDDFKIVLVNNQLTISGYRERPRLENTVHHQLEIGFGEFRIEIILPWRVISDDVTATYREGFLQVDLPRQEAGSVQRVDVTVED